MHLAVLVLLPYVTTMLLLLLLLALLLLLQVQACAHLHSG
jgi:hypothetical protein